MPATDPISISEAESIVMEVIWRRNPIITDDVVAELAHHAKWQEPTVKTLLNRLLRRAPSAPARTGGATSIHRS